MSSFFDDASLVMIPSGFKDGKVYSVKPTSGAGDLTFTRNSNATRVDANGLVEKVRTNSLLQSNQFDTTWVNNGTTETGGQAGYDGTNNAWLINKSTAGGSIRQSIVYNGVGTYSVYAKAGTLNYILLYLNYGSGTDTQAYFDLSSGSVGTTIAEIDANIESVGNGWYRCSVSFNTPSATATTLFFPADADGDTSGTSGNIYIQDAQLEQGLVATSYIETTTTAMSEFAGVTASSVADVPRLDYSGGSCPSLLLEPQRTNNITSSENISTGWTYTNTAVSINQTTSPDGYANADAIVPDATSGQHAINSSNISSSGSFTLSAFVKAGELNKVAIRESNATGAYASFDLSTGTKIEDNVSGDAFIEAFSNGWYRIGVTYTYSGNIRLGINVLSNAYTTGNPSSGATYWSSNGTDKLYIYGMQCEAGSYPTSYIPTYGTTVTRLADYYANNSATDLIGQTEGVLFIDFTPNTDVVSTKWLSFLGGGVDYVGIYVLNGTSKIRLEVAATTNQATFDTTSAIVKGQRYKCAIAYKQNDFVAYVNGVQLGTDTSGNIPSMSTIRSYYNFSSIDSIDTHQLLLFKTRLSNADLANLTAL
jgi:hypothetical protein